MVVSRMRNASGHNYWNSSFIMTWLCTMGQIPRSTERMCSFFISFIVECIVVFRMFKFKLYAVCINFKAAVKKERLLSISCTSRLCFCEWFLKCVHVKIKETNNSWVVTLN